MNSGYWRSPADDEAMQDEHGFIWRAMLGTVDVELAEAKVLDVGCNRGGFLRMLVDRAGIAEGCGYDPAFAAVADARRLAGERPLIFDAAESVPSGWSGFDVAFSHEVLYLLGDLRAHAASVLGALRPGGVYFAVTGVHAGSRLMAAWHAANAAELHLPDLRDLDEVADGFADAGFEVEVARLRLGFVPVSAHRDGGDGRSTLMEWLDYYSDDKVMFRFARPL